MKKVLSFLLAVIMLFSFVTPAFAAYDSSDTISQIPVILISGDGDSIYDADGNEVFRFSNIIGMLTSIESEALEESLYKVVQPLIVEAVIKNDWQPFYDSLETEVGKIFAKCRLDDNGEVTDGSGISQERKDYMADCMVRDKKEGKDGYGLYDYRFWYDWRKDPLEIAEEFNAYVKAIKQATGAPKVSIVTRCLGTSVIMAYIAKYGLDDIHGIGFNGSVANGAEILSEPISGRFRIDGKAVARLLHDVDALGMVELDDFVTSTVDLIVSSGIVDAAIHTTEALLYEKLIEGMTSALALSTFFTWPSYWSTVTTEDFKAAKHHVFGPEGSAKRIKYAKLIEKLDNYDRVVRRNVMDLYRSIKANGVIVGTISKYGYQIVPVIESSDVVADQFASVTRSSFGATTSKVHNTLDEDYIKIRVAQGKGKYISPDKQIDASTCVYPDYTWFTKGSSHSNWTIYEDNLLHIVSTADRQLTINDFDYTQFMVYDSENNTMSPMTTENCGTTNWDAHGTDTFFGKIKAFFSSFAKWFSALIELIKEKLSATAE